jgi:DNA polymerase III, beta subunit
MPFKFNVSRDDFLRAISAQQNIANKKGTLAILANVLLDVGLNDIVLTCTDLEIGLKQTVPAEVFENGKLTLPAKKLFEIARESGSTTISFKEVDNCWVEISAGSSLYRLAGMVADEYPNFPTYNEEKMVGIESEILADLIDKTIFSIAQDKENMFTLTSGLLKKESKENKLFLKMITSDSHRLSIMTREVDSSIDNISMENLTLIPRRGIQEIRKFCDNKTNIFFGIEEKKCVLKCDDSLLIIRLIEGDFPDFQNLINSLQKNNNLRIGRIRFLEGLRRINLFTEDLFNAIKIDIQENKMVLTSQNADFGSAKDEFDIDYQGESLSVGFNCRYFIDSIQVMEGKFINVNINNNESPCIITSDEDIGFLSIIMPMKI